jgi:hypothetical protein
MLDSRVGTLKVEKFTYMRWAQFIVLILILTISFFGYQMGAAQAPGYAEIVSPAPGEAVQGLFTLQGSASHPLFEAYDLAFAYQQAPISTWFSIVERREIEVVDGRLGLWDTSGISDGEYQLRLRVYLENGTTLEDIIEGVRVRNRSQIETPTPAAVSGNQPTATSVPPTSTPGPTPIIIASPPGGSSVLIFLQSGFIIGAAALLSLGIYLYIRRRVRVRWGILRMRRMLWYEDRKKRRGDK